MSNSSIYYTRKFIMPTAIVFDISTKFWPILSTRDDWKKAFLYLQEKVVPKLWDSILILKFTKCDILTPSYLDELVIHLKKLHKEKIFIDSNVQKYIKDNLDFLSTSRDIKIDYRPA